jgi:hypothetical protein
LFDFDEGRVAGRRRGPPRALLYLCAPRNALPAGVAPAALILVGAVQMASTTRTMSLDALPLWTVASHAEGSPGAQRIQSDSLIVAAAIAAGSAESVIAPPPVTTIPPGHTACPVP